MYKKSKGTTTAKSKQSLSTFSYPQKVVSHCQEIIEKKMLADGDKGTRSMAWLATKIHAWTKRKNPFSIALLVDGFIELITAEEKSFTADVEEKVTGHKAKQDNGDDQPREEEVGEVKEHRVFSKTLKEFIKESFDYQLLLQRMEGLQDSCHEAIHGLSANINILVDLVLDGQFTAAAQYFDYSSIDLHHRGIGADTHRMAVLGDIDQNALQMFDFHGFYRILCSVVGQKKSKIKNP